jgi:hypothetical protein
MRIDTWNQSFEDWLIRAAKRKHGTTKRQPVEMFAEEQEHLLPLYGVAPAGIKEEMVRDVRPDNTIWYGSNRYSVPYGTYAKEKKVFLAVEGSELQIMKRIGELIATHEIYEGKGKLIRPQSHRRNKNERIKELLDKTAALLGEEYREYLEVLCEKKPRYVKEQFDIVLKACETYGREKVLAGITYCREKELYSANDLRDATEMLNGQKPTQSLPNRLPVEDERYHILVQNRDLSVYAEVAAGSVMIQ